MIFTIVLWAVALVVYLSNKTNKTNIWCALCFAITSIGTFKEFMMDTVVPIWVKAYPGITYEQYMTVNSCLTAILYLLTPYCVIMLSMYFSGMDEKNRKLFYAVQIATVCIIVLLLALFSPLHYKYYQLNSREFWYCMSAYNLGYGIAGSVMMFRNVIQEENRVRKRQKRLSIEVLSPPYYWWLVTIFVIHTLKFTGYMKVWKLNRYVSIAMLIYYLLVAYREGIMGMRLTMTRYQWNDDITSVDRSTQYVNHMIKNQVAKIQWSVENLRNREPQCDGKELEIICRASRQLLEFTQKTNQYLSTSIADTEKAVFTELIGQALEECTPQLEHVRVRVKLEPEVMLLCDIGNTVEMLSNLISNACAAMEGHGILTITGSFCLFRWSYELRITDTGRGISKENLKIIFQPFYTTKNQAAGNFGLGLPYCNSIMKAHNGIIFAESKEGEGSTFILRYPISRIKKVKR